MELLKEHHEIDISFLLLKMKLVSFLFRYHPYLFFNQDRHTLSFLGFNVDRGGNLLDPECGVIIQHNIMATTLYDDLTRQMRGDLVSLNTNYNFLNRYDI